MHLAGLDLNLIIVLHALFVEKSVSRAAKRVHLSQSATSAALGRLRDFFGDELLVPVGRRMVLTPLAQELVEPVRELVFRADSIVKHNSRFEASRETRCFRLMMADYAVSVLMPSILAQAQHLAPGVTFDIVPFTSQNPFEQLEAGDVDFLVLPKQRANPAHPYDELFSDDYVWIVWTGNKDVKEQITTNQFLSMGHVAVRFPSHRDPVLEEWFSEQFGERRKVEVTTVTFDLMTRLIPGTNRVATLMKRMAVQYAEWLPIRLITPSSRIPSLMLTIQWHKFNSSDPGTNWVRALFAKACETLV